MARTGNKAQISQDPSCAPSQRKRLQASETAKKVRRTQHERSTEARAKLLAAAIDLISANGFSATSMADIAQRAGMTRGAIQHHFTGRNELVIAIMGALEDKTAEALADIEGEGLASFEDKLDLALNRLAENVQTDTYLAVLDIWVSTRADPQLGKAVRDFVARSTRHYRELWGRLFDNDLSPEIQDETLRIIVAVLRGLLVSRIFQIAPRSADFTISIARDAIKSRIADLPRKA